jgi:putative ABC transport system permease protein
LVLSSIFFITRFIFKSELKIQDTLQSAIQGMNEKKFRLALNILGILIGCAAITGLISITQGLTIEISEQLEMFGSTNVMVIPYEIRQGRGLVGEGFNWRDIQIIEKIHHVKYLSPIIGSKPGSHDIKGESFLVNFFGTYPIYFEIFKTFEIEKGRTLKSSDGGSCVIGHLVAQPRGKDTPIIEVGDRVTFNFFVKGEEKEATFRVVGKLKEVGGTFGGEDDNSVIIPFREAQQIFEVGGIVDFVALSVDNIENIGMVINELKDRFDDRVTILSYDMIQQQTDQVLGTIEAVLGGIAAISLLVAGVSIINTMIISVMERTHEIGILKAIGSKKLDILLLFLTEATITGIIGGILGSIFGFILGNIIGNYINLPVSSSPILGLLVIGFAVVTSILAGLYPAWRASNMNPVDALRYE